MYGGSLGTISTAADWRGAFEVRDAETGDLIDLTGCTVTMKVRRPGCCSSSDLLSGSTTGGELSIPDTGIIAWMFSPASLGRFEGGSYEVGVIVSSGDDTSQLLLGSVNVVCGF